MTLDVLLFGSPRFILNKQRLNLSRRKSIALLSYLVVTRQPQSREALIALLWPDYDNATARMNLRRDLSWLRQQLPDDLLLADRLQLEFTPTTAVTVDVHRFEAALAAAQSHSHPQGALCPDCAQSLMAAVDLAEGEFMAGFSLPDSDGFDEWLFFQREHWRQETAVACQRLVQWHSEQGSFEQGINYGRRWLALDPLHEPAHRALMKLYTHADQQAAALRQYSECVRLLDEDLGIEPEAETTALAEAIRTRQYPSPAEKETPPPAPVQVAIPMAPLSTPPTVFNLPPQATTFVGRQSELADIQRLLADPACRLLTLLGPGGMGKTRLGIETAVQLQTHFPHGACFIGLAAVSQPELLPTAVAEALNLPLTGDDSPPAQLLTFLRDRQMLLLFDNLEQLLAARSFLSQIIHTAPGIKILATSRERLHLQEEWVYELLGLETPGTADLTHATSFSAIQLFVQRARQAQANFRLAAEEITAVTTICRLVAGMPLGIELAAGWVSSLSCKEIANELGQNLDLLATPLHNVPERHRNLRVVFDHSWQLLTPSQQTIFARLSVFRGGFTREAARVVAQASLTDLSQLVSKSLLRRSQNGRYDVHGLLRQYAQEKVEAVPSEAKQLGDKHSRYYGGWLQTISPSLHSNQQRELLHQMELDIENIRAGWRWLLQSTDANHSWLALLDQYITPLFHFYDTHSRFQEGEAAFREAAQRVQQTAVAPQLLGKLLGRQGWFTFHLGQPFEAVALLQTSLERLQTSEADAVFSHNYLGAVYRHLGQYALAQEQLETGLTICRRVGDRFGATVALNILGQIAFQQGEYGRAQALCQESLAIKRELGDQWGITFSLTYLGTVARALGEQAQAEQLFNESLTISTEIGDQRGAATSHSHLGDLALARADFADAQQHYQQSYGIFQTINNRLGSLATLTRLGDLALAQQDLPAAWAWLERALQLAQTMPITPQVLDLLTSVAAWQLAQPDRPGTADLLIPSLCHPVSSEENRQRAAPLWQVLDGQRPLPTPTTDLDEQVVTLLNQLLSESS